MIHYHGTPCGGRRVDAEAFIAGRHVLVPWTYPTDLKRAKKLASSFILDNGAFTLWQRGERQSDWSAYYEWVRTSYKHPAFEWAVIPDVIDGDEDANDRLLNEWPHDLRFVGVPVWHLHESLDRVVRLATTYPRIALGSSGEFADPGSKSWSRRMDELMAAICDDKGQPICKLHGLRMLAIDIFTKYPLASADSTNATQNGNREGKRMSRRFGTSARMSLTAMGQRTIAESVESWPSAERWKRRTSPQKQRSLLDYAG